MTQTRPRLDGGWWIAALACMFANVGCCEESDLASSAGSNGAASANEGSGQAATVDFYRPKEPVVIEESDLLKVDGTWLYVLNEHTGLNVIDASQPESPELAARLESLAGAGGELYVRDKSVLALARDSDLECHALAPPGLEHYPSTGIAVVLSPESAPEIASERCVPGDLVTSRLVGDILYVVTTAAPSEPERGWLFSVDVASPGRVEIIEDLPLDGGGVEIHMTNEAVFIAEERVPNTRLRYIDISASDGSLVERDDIDLAGTPAGRFHMDAEGSTFRIVTRGVSTDASHLHVVDISNPDSLLPLSSINDLAPGEELFATRFVGDRAYVVTYQPEIIVEEEVVVRGTDPLWVVSLEDPTAPQILGELQIPGWSDYIFPRGQLLLTVGRGDAGSQVAASLFEVSDPQNPIELRQLQFGSATASSEASSDFRAVRIIDDDFGAPPLVVVPYSDNVQQREDCVPEHYIQLLEIENDDIEFRGNLEQPGRVLRTLPVEDSLYVVTTRSVTANDVSVRDVPRAVGTVEVGNPALPDECVFPPEAPQRIVTVTTVQDGWEGGSVNSTSRGSFCACSVTASSSRCRGRHIWGLLFVLSLAGFGLRLTRWSAPSARGTALRRVARGNSSLKS